MSYDEQRISDQIDGGLHQQNQQEMTQTMTKEQIVKRELNGEEIEFFGDNMGNLFDCMEIYKDQQLSAERERAGKLVEAVQSFVQASDDFNIGYINRNGEITRCGIAALSVAFNDAEKRLRIALTEYNKP